MTVCRAAHTHTQPAVVSESYGGVIIMALFISAFSVRLESPSHFLNCELLVRHLAQSLFRLAFFVARRPHISLVYRFPFLASRLLIWGV